MPEPSPFPDLQTQRLRLREIVASDADDLFAIHGDPVVMRWFGSEPVRDVAAAQDLIALFAAWRTQANPGIRWGLERKDRPGLIGTCGLFGWNRSWRKCVLGYELAPHAQGQRLMREALAVAIPWGWAHMALNRIEAQIHPDNAASIRLAASLGFVEEGRLREVGYWSGQHHDMLQFSLLARDWTGPVAGA